MGGLDPTLVADHALNSVQTLSKFQYLAASCSIVLFSLGSQVFYLIPFYLYYPDLKCTTALE